MLQSVITVVAQQIKAMRTVVDRTKVGVAQRTTGEQLAHDQQIPPGTDHIKCLGHRGWPNIPVNGRAHKTPFAETN